MLASRLPLALVVAFLAWLALPGTFVFDDHSLFQSPAVVADDAWRHWLSSTQTRPLTYVTFWLDYHLWGPVAAGFRFTNLLIHLAVSALVFFTARQLSGEFPARIAAALFALHPLAHEPLLYVFARSSSLAAAFTLAALYLWLRDRPWPAAACFALGLLAKEEWVAFPIALWILDRTRRHTYALLTMLAASIIAGARVLLATKSIAGAGSGFGQSTSPWEYFLLQGQAIPAYLWRIVLPIGMSIDPPRPTPNLEAAILFWVVLALLAVWAFRRAPWPLAALILLLPSSSILPAADALAWRRMYLPLAILALAAAAGAKARPRLALAALALLTLAAAARRDTWQSEAALWRDAVAESPTGPRPYIQLARVSPPAEARALLNRATEIAPTNADVASELGRVWLASGNAAQALAEFGRALALAPGEARHVQNRGVVLLYLGQTDAARSDFERALATDPCLVPARENLRRLGANPAPPPAQCPIINSAVK